MKNRELANIFYEIADFLRIEEVSFKPQAYEKVAVVLEALDEDVADLYKREGRRGLEDIPGVGESIADKIEEYLKTGSIRYYQRLKREMPIKVEELSQVEGLGPKKIKVLYEKLGIKNLRELEKAAKRGKIAPLFGFGEKTEKNILEGIKFLKRSQGRFLLGDILPLAREIKQEIESLKEVERISLAGSLIRKKETIGDIDLLAVIKSPKKSAGSFTKASLEKKLATKKVMDYFVSLPGVIKVLGKGPTKSSVRLKEGFDVDLRVVPGKSYGSALQYFTGSKEHNVETRKIAIEKGLKLNEYGVFRGKKMMAGKSEEEVYKILGMEWMPPEIRENQGEIEAALESRLPQLIGYNDIKGDLHCHSSWDGGEHSIKEMAKEAQKMGYEYLGISDHTKFLRIENGLDEKQLAKQRKEVDKLNWKLKIENCKFRILQGCEANILKDGSIDINDEALKKLDYAIAGIHSSFKISKKEMTERIIKAIKNPYINIISHPTGRLLKKRDEYQVDFNKVLRAAKEYKVILEINSSPQRLDLNDQNIRKAKEVGVKMVINTDSHHKDQLKYMELGIAQARRGWAEKKDIVNTQPLNKLLELFKQTR